MTVPNTLLDSLNTNKIPYEILPHTKAYTARMAAAAEAIPREHQAKVVMVSSVKGPAMIVLPADRKLDLRKLRRFIHEPVSLQSEAEFAPIFPDCEKGGMPTYVDQHLAEEDYIVFEAGTYTDAIRISYADYERAVRPLVADLAIDHSEDFSTCS
jgi:Ala-tRNA(Pro) deacylase